MSRTLFHSKAAAALDDERGDLQQVDLHLRERERWKRGAELGIVGIEATSFFFLSLRLISKVNLEELSEDGIQLVDVLSGEVGRVREETQEERGGFSLKRMVGVSV